MVVVDLLQDALAGLLTDLTHLLLLLLDYHALPLLEHVLQPLLFLLELLLDHPLLLLVLILDDLALRLELIRNLLLHLLLVLLVQVDVHHLLVLGQDGEPRLGEHVALGTQFLLALSVAQLWLCVLYSLNHT